MGNKSSSPENSENHDTDPTDNNLINTKKTQFSAKKSYSLPSFRNPLKRQKTSESNLETKSEEDDRVAQEERLAKRNYWIF